MKKPDLKTELMEVTPAQAARWLELNNDNRNISDQWVEAITSDIAAGRWDPNNASIGLIVDEKGDVVKVADGQHRLWAIVNAKRAIWTLVVRGTEDNLRRENIDRVKPRSVADQLQLLDHVGSARIVTSYIGVIRDLEGASLGHSILTLEQARAYRAKYATELDWVIALGGGANQVNLRRIRKGGVGGTLAFCYKTSPAKVDAFAKQVRDGENISRTDPAYALRTYMDRVDARTASGGKGAHGTQFGGRHEIMAMTLRATMAAIKGENLSALKPGAILGGTFYRDACRWFGRAHAGGVIVRKRSA